MASSAARLLFAATPLAALQSLALTPQQEGPHLEPHLAASLVRVEVPPRAGSLAASATAALGTSWTDLEGSTAGSESSDGGASGGEVGSEAGEGSSEAVGTLSSHGFMAEVLLGLSAYESGKPFQCIGGDHPEGATHVELKEVDDPPQEPSHEAQPESQLRDCVDSLHRESLALVNAVLGNLSSLSARPDVPSLWQVWFGDAATHSPQSDANINIVAKVYQGMVHTLDKGIAYVYPSKCIEGNFKYFWMPYGQTCMDKEELAKYAFDSVQTACSVDKDGKAVFYLCDDYFATSETGAIAPLLLMVAYRQSIDGTPLTSMQHDANQMTVMSPQDKVHNALNYVHFAVALLSSSP